MKILNHYLQNSKRFLNRLSLYGKIATRIWPKIDTFVRFAADRKYIVTSFPATFMAYVAGSIEVVSSSSFLDINKKPTIRWD